MSLSLIPTDSSGQSAYAIFDCQHQNIMVATTFSRLENSAGFDELELPSSGGLRAGYNYIYSLNNFYGIGIGVQAGYIKYVIQLRNQIDKKSDVKIMTLNFPLFINKYYPFNNKLALHVKAGININMLFSSVSGLGKRGDEGIYYTAHLSYNLFPQPGILFELGTAYRIVNKNFITLCLLVNKNFMHAVEVEYIYESPEEEGTSGNFYGTGSYLGIAISYIFFPLKSK